MASENVSLQIILYFPAVLVDFPPSSPLLQQPLIRLTYFVNWATFGSLFQRVEAVHVEFKFSKKIKLILYKFIHKITFLFSLFFNQKLEFPSIMKVGNKWQQYQQYCDFATSRNQREAIPLVIEIIIKYCLYSSLL